MADGTIQIPPDSTGKKLDTESLTVGANTVQRQRVQIAGVSDVAIAAIASDEPATHEQALCVRLTRPASGNRASATNCPALTTTTIIAAPGAGFHSRLFWLAISNNNAAATTVTLIDSTPTNFAMFTVPAFDTLIVPLPEGYDAASNTAFQIVNPHATQAVDVSVLTFPIED